MLKIINNYLLILRPYQWLKNMLLFFPPFFGGTILTPTVHREIVPAIVSFSLSASCCYIINDIVDRETDSYHPDKKNRVIARGDISIVFAVTLSAFLYIFAMLIASAVSERFVGHLIIYLLISFSYTIYFKHIVIVDVFFISLGFLIRILAGGEAFHVNVSGWLLLTVYIVALFLAAGKRFGELVALGNDAQKHRVIFKQYTKEFLDGMLWFSASAALVMYTLYTIENKNEMFYTVPIVAFGLVRYIFVLKKGQGDPTEVLLHDKQIMATCFIWISMIGIILYK